MKSKDMIGDLMSALEKVERVGSYRFGARLHNDPVAKKTYLLCSWAYPVRGGTDLHTCAKHAENNCIARLPHNLSTRPMRRDFLTADGFHQGGLYVELPPGYFEDQLTFDTPPEPAPVPASVNDARAGVQDFRKPLPGELVRLKSGGPVMTVEGVISAGSHVDVAWYADATPESFRRDTLPISALDVGWHDLNNSDLIGFGSTGIASYDRRTGQLVNTTTTAGVPAMADTTDPTLNLIFDSAKDAGSMILGMAAQEGVTALGLELLGASGLNPAMIEFLKTDNGKRIAGIVGSLLVHGALTHGPGTKIPGATIGAMAAGAAFKGNLVLAGHAFMPDPAKLLEKVMNAATSITTAAQSAQMFSGLLSADPIPAVEVPVQNREKVRA